MSRTVGGMELRRATDADLDGIAAARLSNGSAHHDSGANPDYCRFLIAHGHLCVAVDGDAVLGFGGAVDVGDARLLSDLYVHRDAHGRGIGNALLAEVLRDATATFTFASTDPAAQAIYARAGMVPTWVLSTLHGTSVALHGRAAAGLAVRDVGIDEAAAFEGGHDRPAVLQYWSGRAGTRVLGVFDRDALIGVAVVHVDGDTAHVEHLVADDRTADAVIATVATATGAAMVEAYVPAVRPLHRQLAALGFEVVDRSTFMTSTAGVVADRLQVVHPGLC